MKLQHDTEWREATQAEVDARIASLPPSQRHRVVEILRHLRTLIDADSRDVAAAHEAFQRLGSATTNAEIGELVMATREHLSRVEARSEDGLMDALRKDLIAEGIEVDVSARQHHAYGRLLASVDLKIAMMDAGMTRKEQEMVASIGPEQFPTLWEKVSAEYKEDQAIRHALEGDGADAECPHAHHLAYVQLVVAERALTQEADRLEVAPEALEQTRERLTVARAKFFIRHIVADYASGETDTIKRVILGARAVPPLSGRKSREWLADLDVFKAKFARHEYSPKEAREVLEALTAMGGNLEAAVAEIARLKYLIDRFAAGPTHLEALDMQWKALKACDLMFHQYPQVGQALQLSTLGALRAADTYCWSASTVEAVASAGAALPDDCAPSALALGEFGVPGRAGWWWFSEPVPIKTITTGEPVAALLWRRESLTAGGHQLSVQVFVIRSVGIGGRSQMVPLPTLAFVWKDGETLAELARVSMNNLGELIVNPITRPEHATTPEEANEAVVWFAKFYLAAAMWLRQRVVIEAIPATGVRQLSRQIQRDHKLKATPKVQVIELRRRAVTQTIEPDGDEHVDATGKRREWSCRWVVGGALGFIRNQWYPKQGVHAPKWIAPFEKGPKDKPLRTTARVYAVRR